MPTSGLAPDGAVVVPKMSGMDSHADPGHPTTVVIVPVYNAAEVLPRQLRALDNQTDLDFRVVVSDNRSTDGLRRVCGEWQPRFRQLDVVDASGQRGAAYARNAAIGVTDEDLILMCDADDRVHPEWVAAMKEGLGMADIVTGPLHLVFPDSPGRHEIWNADSVPVSMGFLPYAPSGNVGIRRAVAETIGTFDRELSLGQEDVDFGWRAVQAGFVLTHAPLAKLDYYQRSGLRRYLRQQRQYGRAQVLLYDKHRLDTGVPAPASTRTSVRWFWEWMKQLPKAARRGDMIRALGAAAFQGSRLAETLRRNTPSPL